MCPESFLELCPGEPSALGKHGHVIVPQSACGTPELLGCKSGLVIIIVWVQGELRLNSLELVVCFQWLIRLVKKWRLGPQKLLLPRNRWRVVVSWPRCCPLLHKLMEECRLLVAPSEHGRNGLNQIRRRQWHSTTLVCHSAFNHDWFSHIILIIQK